MKKIFDLWVHSHPILKKLIMELKIAFLIIVINVSNVLAIPSYSQLAKVSLDMENKKLEQVMDEIERQSELYFIFNQKQIDVNRIVSIHADNMLVTAILPELFTGTKVNYVVLDKKILLTTDPLENSLLAIALGNESQQKQISGKVTDETGSPLPGVTVHIKGTTLGALTDVTGKYTLNNAPQNATLIFSFVGMTTQEIQSENRPLIDVVLKQEAIGLEEVVVIGYGTQKKVTLTGAVASIKSDEILAVKSQNVQNMLTGKIPGVRVVQKTSEPGAYDNQFDIRGFGTPLIVIDGIPRGDYQRLDPNDIESISVLKDASAAIYGVQGANGVVLITTKKGEAGTIKISYNGYTGIQRASGAPDVVGVIDWMTLRNETTMRNYNNPTHEWPQSTFDAYNNGTLTGSNWYPEVLTRNATQSQNTLTASGGSDKVTFYLSLGSTYQGSYAKSKDLTDTKYNVRSNITAKITKRLTAVLMINGINDTKNQPFGGLSYASLWRVNPTIPIYANNDPTQPYYTNSGDVYNPMALADKSMSGYRKNITNIFQGSFSLKYDIPYISGLSAKGLFSYDWTTSDNKDYQKSYLLYLPTSPTTATAYPLNIPQIVRYYGSSASTLKQLSLNYNHAFGGHNVDATVVYEERNSYNDNISATRNLIFNNLDQLGAGTTVGQIGTQNPGGGNATAMKSAIGKIHYDFKGKYLLDLTGRYDGSSDFTRKRQWGFFPSILAAWRISEESFMKNITAFSFINNLKIRGSYGVMGDKSGVTFQWLNGYNYPLGVGDLSRASTGTGFNEAFVGGLGFKSANPDFTWYTVKTLDFGIDAELWKGLLGFQFDWFNRNRTGLPAKRNAALPGEYGAALPDENLNSDRSRGFDLLLTHRSKIGELNYNISGNFSYARNSNLYVERAMETNSKNNWRNNPNDRYMNIWWGLGANGRFQSYDEIYNYQVNQSGGNQGILPGDYKYVDWNNDGYIDDNDTHPIGSNYTGSGSQPTPPLINFGLSLGAEYKGFDLNVLFQGASGKYIAYDGPLNTPFPWPNSNALSGWLDRWHPVDANADPFNPNTKWESGYYAYAQGLNNSSEFGVQNASYLRLKSLELGYTLPQSISKKAWIQKVRMYVNGYNLFTITGIRMVDPEHPSDQASYAYPLSKTYNVGLNITF
jgi:TonB-linked SusC/RagA family outer membrane protein